MLLSVVFPTFLHIVNSPISAWSIVYDMLPYSWIREYLDMFGIASNIKRLLYMIMEEWRTELHSMSTPIGEVKITRGIFQGDALSPLIFVIALIPLSMLLRKARDGFDLSGEKINHLM